MSVTGMPDRLVRAHKGSLLARFLLKQNRSGHSARKSPRRMLFEGLEARAVLAAFTPGDLVVYRVGTGTGSLVNTGNAVFIDEFTPSGTLVQSIALPTTNNGTQRSLIASGTATSEGMLTRSVDGQYLVLAGYNATPGGTTNIVGTTSATVSRVVARIGADGTIDTSTALSDYASASNPRGVVSTNGTDIWITGGAGGVRYTTFGSTTSTQLSTTVTNLRNVAAAAGQLYVSSGSGTTRLATVGTGVPTTAGQTITNIPGIPTTGSPYGFFFADLSSSVAGVDTLYVASDDSAGLTKYSLVGGNWTSNGLIGAAADLYRGLTGVVSGSTVTLYSTRRGGSAAAGGGELVSIIDTAGYNGAFAGTPTVLATAAANTAFRGVAFAPVSPDVAPPTISSLVPANTSTAVPIASNLVMTFNENVAKGTGNILIRRVSDNSIAQTIDVTSIAVTVSGAVVTIDPSDLTANTGYYIEVAGTAIRDLSNNFFAGISGSGTWSFTTASAADTTPPTITLLSPADNSTNIALNSDLVITFSENVAKGTGNVLIKRTSDDATVQSIDVAGTAVTIVRAVATINPPTDLANGVSYYIQIPGTAFKDLSDNFFAGISNTTDWNFTTVPDTTPPTVISIDDGDADNVVLTNQVVNYTIVFSEDINDATVTAADFNNAGTASISVGAITETVPGTFTIAVTPTSAGTLVLRIPVGAVIQDLAGNALVVPVSDNDTLVVNVPDVTPPTLVSITDNRPTGTSSPFVPITFTVTFSEDIVGSSVTAADFDNAGTATINFGAISETAATSGIFTVVVTPTSVGTLRLRIPTGSIITDNGGNNLAVPVQDDTTINIVAGTTLTAGDIAFTGIQTDDPDTFSFVLLKDIVDGTTITFTDNGWGGAGFTGTGENTATAAFVGSYSAGAHFVISNPGSFQLVGTSTSAGTLFGNLSGLSTAGDSILAYQGLLPTSDSAANWVAGINTKAWNPAPTGTNESALPAALGANGVNAIQLSSTATDLDDGAYNKTTFAGSIAEIRASVNNIANWTTSDTVGPLATTTFTVVTYRLAINDVTIVEGNSGTTNAVFTVTLSAAPSLQSVTVDYATADGTATQASDYTSATGTLTFAPGETVKTISVPIIGDTTVEADETFVVNLSNGVNATIADAQGLGTISNDDSAALPTLVSVVVNGGDTFLNRAQRSQVTSIVVTLSAPISSPATAFTITNIGLYQATNIPLASSQILVTANANVYTLRFAAGPGVVSRAGTGAAGNSLADGNYRLTIDSTRITGNNTFGAVAADNFFRIYGDADGDGDVDGTDLTSYRRSSLLAPSAANPYNAALDADGDGVTFGDADDRIAFLGDASNPSNLNKRRRVF